MSRCHDHCFLKGVAQETLGVHEFQFCEAMNPVNGKFCSQFQTFSLRFTFSTVAFCLRCGCHCQAHKHIRYEYVSQSTYVKCSSSYVLVDHVKKRIFKDSKYLHKIDAILLYNNAVVDYVKYFIDLEQKRNDGKEKVEQNLKTLIKNFEEHVVMFEKKTLKTNKNCPLLAINLRLQEVSQVFQNLYDLPITSYQISQQVQTRANMKREIKIQFPMKNVSSEVIQWIIQRF